jgi:hypothetical protein
MNLESSRLLQLSAKKMHDRAYCLLSHYQQWLADSLRSQRVVVSHQRRFLPCGMFLSKPYFDIVDSIIDAFMQFR